jgi:formate dehydrogenase major subunit
MTWNYSTPHEPASEEVAMESNGKALADITDPATGAVIVKKGQQLSSFAQLRRPPPAAAGSSPVAGRRKATRWRAAITPIRQASLGWAWAWPLNRRILYNRASADPQGKPWDPKRQLLKWDGAKWGGVDIPDYSAAAAATSVRLSCSRKGWASVRYR